jgi:hypothetical protein
MDPPGWAPRNVTLLERKSGCSSGVMLALSLHYSGKRRPRKPFLMIWQRHAKVPRRTGRSRAHCCTERIPDSGSNSFLQLPKVRSIRFSLRIRFKTQSTKIYVRFKSARHPPRPIPGQPPACSLLLRCRLAFPLQTLRRPFLGCARLGPSGSRSVRRSNIGGMNSALVFG